MIKSEKCIGCQACVDVCPVKAINFIYDNWGEGKAKIDTKKCVNCGLCENICPSDKMLFNKEQAKIYAAVSHDNRKKGSSGGIFYELAKYMVESGGVVFGAAFDNNLKLIHQRAETIEQIIPLCKSKYIHSNAQGIYNEIGVLLKQGKEVLFVGTPCQVSALKNLYSSRYSNLILIDFLCHGTGTQKIFDLCIQDVEKKKGGKINTFSFRAKSKKAEHSFTYVICKNGKNKTIKGYPFEFSYYNSFLKYNIFTEACYSCKYSKTTRVGDITLGDFWGIDKFNSSLKDVDGVSLISVNSKKGEELVRKIKDSCDWYCYPLEYGTRKNQAFNQPVQLLNEKVQLNQLLNEKGESELIREMSCSNIFKRKIYARTPQIIIDIYHMIRGAK